MAAFGLGVEKLRCPRYDRVFTCPDEFEKYINIPKPIFRSFYCLQCDYSHESKDAVIAHIRTHMEDLPFNCPFCKKSYKFYYSLEFHLPIHQRVEVVACKYCKKSFDASDGGRACKKHQKIHDKGKERYVCLTCKKTFAETEALLKHHRSHVNAR